MAIRVEVAAAARWAGGRAAGWRGPVRLHVMLVSSEWSSYFSEARRAVLRRATCSESESTASFRTNPAAASRKRLLGEDVDGGTLVGGYGGRRHDKLLTARDEQFQVLLSGLEPMAD